jgi:hypothetical protein
VGVALSLAELRVAEDLLDDADVDALLEQERRAVWRASRTRASRTPASLRRACQSSQWSRESTGVPVGVQKTRSQSCQDAPAVRRSAAWSRRWARSRARSGAGRARTSFAFPCPGFTPLRRVKCQPTSIVPASGASSRVSGSISTSSQQCSQPGRRAHRVSGLPALPALPESRLRSSWRTLLVTSDSVLPLRWRRSGEPSSLVPTVTQPCQRPSGSQ